MNFGKNHLDFRSILYTFVRELQLQELVQDSKQSGGLKIPSATLFDNDKFLNGLIIIAFTECCICVATWMIYLVMFLLPRHFHIIQRIKLLHFYILFAAIFETYMFSNKSIDQFKKQYYMNIQSVQMFESNILTSDLYNCYQLLSFILNMMNWSYIIYFLFNNHKRLKHFPWPFHNPTSIIVVLSTVTTTVYSILYIIVLWYRDSRAINNFFTAINIINVSILMICLVYYIKTDASYIFFTSTNQSLTTTGYLRVLYNDFHETLPILTFNIIIVVIYYYVLFYRIAFENDSVTWKYSVIRFFKLFITVNVWLLIVVFEKREQFLRRKTFIGRQIDNKDTLYANPTQDIDNSSSYLNEYDYNDEVSYPNKPIKPISAIFSFGKKTRFFLWNKKNEKSSVPPIFVHERFEQGDDNFLNYNFNDDNNNDDLNDSNRVSIETELQRNVLYERENEFD